MKYQFSDLEKEKISQTLSSILKVIDQLIAWNNGITSSNDYFLNEEGVQLLTADCTLFTAIGEGINRINRISDFLFFDYPDIPWKGFIGMRNHIAHGYFELDADLVFEAIQKDVPPLREAIIDALNKLKEISS